MATYLLTWSPKRWEWDELPENVLELESHKVLSMRWSTGNTQSMEPGDRLYLMRQGVEPRGIMGSGVATSTVYAEKHFDPKLAAQGKMAWRVNLDFDALIDADADPQAILTLNELMRGSLAAVNWNTPASGISIPEEAAMQLEKLWKAKLAGGPRVVRPPEEVEKSKHLYEGTTQTIQVNIYERNPVARRACISYWGVICSVCKFEFEKIYGRLGRGFIHVHHLRPLASIGKTYKVDPIKDLRPICPNCHAMIHKVDPPLSIEDLQKRIRRAAR